MSLIAAAPSISAKAGIRPVPWRMIVAISSRDRRWAMSSSDGAVVPPFLSSPWQLAHALL